MHAPGASAAAREWSAAHPASAKSRARHRGASRLFDVGEASRLRRHYLVVVKRSTDLSRLRALGQMGLAQELFIPALLEELHHVIPSARNLFDWADASGRLLHYYFEGPIDPAINERYFAEFHNRLEADVMPPFRESLRAAGSVRRASDLDNAAFYRSALYNEIWRPQHLHSRIEAVVRDRRGLALGSLVLYRGPHDRSFTPLDEALLAQALPYIARGLELGSAAGEEVEFSLRHGRSATLLLGADGEIESLSSDALKLLLLAHGGVTPEAASRRPRREDFASLTTLCSQLDCAAGSGTTRSARLAVRNAWGRFVFEASPLRPVGRRAQTSICVTITHQEARALALRRVVRRLGLTPAQERVCLLLHQGRAPAEIACEIGVAASTVADHVRKIYARLDVHSARELDAVIERLLDAPEPT